MFTLQRKEQSENECLLISDCSWPPFWHEWGHLATRCGHFAPPSLALNWSMRLQQCHSEKAGWPCPYFSFTKFAWRVKTDCLMFFSKQSWTWTFSSCAGRSNSSGLWASSSAGNYWGNLLRSTLVRELGRQDMAEGEVELNQNCNKSFNKSYMAYRS